MQSYIPLGSPGYPFISSICPFMTIHHHYWPWLALHTWHHLSPCIGTVVKHKSYIFTKRPVNTSISMIQSPLWMTISDHTPWDEYTATSVGASHCCSDFRVVVLAPPICDGSFFDRDIPWLGRRKTGWWYESLWKIVSWLFPIYVEKSNMFQTTN